MSVILFCVEWPLNISCVFVVTEGLFIFILFAEKGYNSEEG